MSLRAPLVLLALAAAASAPARHRTPERIRADDNLRPAGTLRGGVLTLRLDARVGVWHPDGDDAPGAPVPAFAEVGRALQIPGPMIRVPAGTEVAVTLTNHVRSGTLTVHGLVSRPIAGGQADSVQVAPGASREVRFRLDAPGTYYYWGTTTGRAFVARVHEDAQLSGAIVVDEPAAPPPRDRVLVIGLWADTVSSELNVGRTRARFLPVVNGRSWPHTTRLSYTVGDTVRWRVINASADVHPMHLHGFYFGVDSRGDGLRDSTYLGAARDRVVTERLLQGRTMTVSWVPERPGNWLFHCHTAFHFEPRGPLGTLLRPAADGAHGRGTGDHSRGGMSGLVVGVTVAPGRSGAGGGVASPDPARRRLRLLARPIAGGTPGSPLYAFTLLEGAAPEPPPDAGSRVGPPIVLTRGQPVGITVVNRTPEPTAVHWHGIELESYFDGVPGFSGNAARLAPAIAPGDSFEARFTPPRAGTFIYHSHLNEMRQQPAGLTGPIIVLEPGQRYDPATDIPVLITTPRDTLDESRAVLLNGSQAPAPLDLRAGVPVRLRLVNITLDRPGVEVLLRRDTTLLGWRVLAKDGAALPDPRQALRPARQTVSIGETLDVGLTPDAPGPLRLEVRTRAGRLLGAMPVRVTGVAGAGAPQR